MQVPDPNSQVAVYSVRSSAILLVKDVTRTLPPLSTRFLICSSRSSTWFEAGLSSMIGSMRPVGRMICSTTRPLPLASSKAPGVAETYMAWLTWPSNSSNCRGRLSRALGSRNP